MPDLVLKLICVPYKHVCMFYFELLRSWMRELHQPRLDRETALGIRARGAVLGKEMTKKNAFLKSGKRNVT